MAILSGIITVVSWVVTSFIAFFNMMYEKGSNALSRLGDALSEFADSILPAWASNGLHTIVSFVQKAIGWLQKLIDKIFHTNNALSKAGNKAATQDIESDDSSDDESSASDVRSGTPTYKNFRTAGDEASTGSVGGAGSSGGTSGAGSYNVREGALYNAKQLEGLSYGTDDGQVVCTTYVENVWSQAGVSNAFDLGSWAPDWQANAGSAFHQTDAYGNGYDAKPGDVVITNDGGHVIMVGENGGYYASGSSQNNGVSSYFSQNWKEAFGGNIVGVISLADYAGIKDPGYNGDTGKPSINWDSSNELQAIHAAASLMGRMPNLWRLWRQLKAAAVILMPFIWPLAAACFRLTTIRTFATAMAVVSALLIYIRNTLRI